MWKIIWGQKDIEQKLGGKTNKGKLWGVKNEGENLVGKKKRREKIEVSKYKCEIKSFLGLKT